MENSVEGGMGAAQGWRPGADGASVDLGQAHLVFFLCFFLS